VHILDNPSLIIHWMNRNIHLSNNFLRPLGDQLKLLGNSFEEVSFTHIYKELNKEADVLSKAVVQITERAMLLEEIRGGSSVIS